MSLPPAKKLDFETAVTLNSFDKSVNNIDRLPDDVLKKRLGIKAQQYIDSCNRFKHQCFELEEEDATGEVVRHIPSYLKVPPFAEKLFEGAYIEDVDAPVGRYVFTKIIGYCNYFSALVIILRDREDQVVDLIKYRPFRDGYEKLPKYLYEKSENKPAGRGDDFLYPFQLEMERLIEKEEYVFIGEGLKNAVNALIRSVPYVSIEGVTNASSKEIAEYVNRLSGRGIRVYGALDGDDAGEKAFNKINKLLDNPIINLIDFDSGIDFTDFLRKEQL